MESIIIKRYKNRKLYNTKTALYISNRDVLALYDAKERFNVIDMRTQKDITAKQIVSALLPRLKAKIFSAVENGEVVAL